MSAETIAVSFIACAARDNTSADGAGAAYAASGRLVGSLGPLTSFKEA